MTYQDKKQEEEEVSIGVDVGGTHILAIVMNRTGTIYSSEERDILAKDRMNIDQIIQLLVDCIISLIKKQTNKMMIVGIGLGIPGNVNPDTGHTRYLPNFGWLEPVPLRSLLQQKLSTNTTTTTMNNNYNIQMRNDGRCAALAEQFFSTSNTSGSGDYFAMMTLGTGIGGAFLFSGQTLLDGCSYDAGDFGHHVICSGQQAFDCVCGKRGCFETQASAAGLVRHYNHLLSKRKKEEEEEQSPLVSLDNAKYVMDLVVSNQSNVAEEAFENYLHDLSTGIANVITFYNPSMIVLGGKLGQHPLLYSQFHNRTLQQRVDDKTLPATRGKCRIQPARLASNSGAMGAALLPFLYPNNKKE